MEMETLQCRAGHSFERQKVRGKKPVWCDEHRPSQEPTTETLQCKAGHTWTRQSARGKKPLWCPEHRSQVTQVPNPQEPREALERAREAKEAIRATRQTEMDRTVEKILGNVTINPELKLKLEYAHRHSDHAGMTARRDELIRESQRKS